jgi:hypothetical protein
MGCVVEGDFRLHRGNVWEWTISFSFSFSRKSTNKMIVWCYKELFRVWVQRKLHRQAPKEWKLKIPVH